jgi:hypothetical protein
MSFVNKSRERTLPRVPKKKRPLLVLFWYDEKLKVSPGPATNNEASYR